MFDDPFPLPENRNRLKRKLRAISLPLLFTSLCLYFIWHSIHGSYGILAGIERRKEIAAARELLDKKRAEIQTLERRINALKGNLIDGDLLDEQARTSLNLVNRNEIVIPFDRDKPLAQQR